MEIRVGRLADSTTVYYCLIFLAITLAMDEPYVNLPL